jgi:hypothetical protein
MPAHSKRLGRIESNRRGSIFTTSFEGQNADATLEARASALMSVRKARSK